MSWSCSVLAVCLTVCTPVFQEWRDGLASPEDLSPATLQSPSYITDSLIGCTSLPNTQVCLPPQQKTLIALLPLSKTFKSIGTAGNIVNPAIVLLLQSKTNEHRCTPTPKHSCNRDKWSTSMHVQL